MPSPPALSRSEEWKGRGEKKGFRVRVFHVYIKNTLDTASPFALFSSSKWEKGVRG
jgi:hypothetical protein